LSLDTFVQPWQEFATIIRGRENAHGGCGGIYRFGPDGGHWLFSAAKRLDYCWLT
jgi:hypothetical protein